MALGDQEDVYGLVHICNDKILVTVYDDSVLLLYPSEKLSVLSGDLPSFVFKVRHIVPVEESRYEVRSTCISSFMHVLYILKLFKT